VLVQLVLTYCLVAEPMRCVDHRPISDPTSEAGLHSCVLGAQPEAARWLTEHPGYELRRWRCEMGRREERAA